MRRKNTIILILVFAVMLTLQSCQQPHGNSTGSEYMPDMAHSVAYEANYYSYYYNNRWGGEDEYYKYAKPRTPVSGTVPRGGAHSDSTPKSVPYYYGNSDAEAARAAAEIIQNPLPITDLGLAQGKELYNTFCGICHGAKADGNGYLVRDDGGVYPVQPAILNSDEFKAASNGRYYHAIMQGKNLMGAYKDKLTYEERWNVIHYIRSLHAKEAGAEYNQFVNTLNNIDEPAGEIAVVEEVHMEEAHDAHGSHHDTHGGSHDAHGVDHDSHDAHGVDHDSHDGHGGDHDSHDAHGGYHDSHDGHGGDHDSHDGYGGDHESHDGHGGDHDSHDGHGGDHDSHDGHGGDHDSHDAHGGDHDSHDAHGGDHDSHDEGHGLEDDHSHDDNHGHH